MDSKSLYLALSEILNATKREVINWRINGSANLFIQGIPIVPMDLDITTNPSGLQKFEKALKRFSPIKTFSEKAKCHGIKCTIAGIEVEILSYEDERSMLAKTRPIYWSRLVVPGLSLEDSMYFYRMISAHDKVEMIANFLSSQVKKV